MSRSARETETDREPAGVVRSPGSEHASNTSLGKVKPVLSYLYDLKNRIESTRIKIQE